MRGIGDAFGRNKGETDLPSKLWTVRKAAKTAPGGLTWFRRENVIPESLRSRRYIWLPVAITSVTEVAKDLEIHPNTLYKWIHQYGENPQEAFPGKGKQPAEAEELTRLKHFTD